VEFLLAFLVTGLAASGGWLVWGLLRWWSTRRARRHELAVERTRAQAQIRQAELAAHLRELELAAEAYEDFARRHPDPPR
jgi:hypothetical protein